MSAETHHSVPFDPGAGLDEPPVPNADHPRWMDSFARAFGDDADARWGRRIVRHASDMLVVCDGGLRILYHNRAFLRSIGYQAGSYVGQSLLSFFPEMDRAEAEAAFRRLVDGRSAGMRIAASYRTLRGERHLEARVIRRRCQEDSFHLYLVARDDTERVEHEKELEAARIEPLFNGLPVAAFRTDRRLRIVRAFGELWREGFGVEAKRLVGADLSRRDCERTPPFLREIDYCDTMAALSLRDTFTWNGGAFEVTVEPFIDGKKRVVGSVGLIRRAKWIARMPGSPEFPFPGARDQTQSIEQPRRLSLDDEVSEKEIARIRDSICPRRLIRNDLEGDEERDSVALAN